MWQNVSAIGIGNGRATTPNIPSYVEGSLLVEQPEPPLLAATLVGPQCIRRKWISRIALLLVAVAGTLLAAEAILRYAETTSSYFVHTPGSHRIFRPMDGVMPGVEGESKFLINAQGLRGPIVESRHNMRILCVGGSTTECMILDEKETWPALLRDQLMSKADDKTQIWVGNAGKSGCNSRHNLLQVEELLKKLQDIDILVVLIGVNDLAHRLAADQNYASWERGGKATDSDLYKKAFDISPVTPATNRPTVLTLSSLRSRFSRLLNKWAPPPELQAQIQDEAGASYNMWRRYRRKARQIRTELPDLVPALTEYERNLRAIITTARRYNVRCVFVTQPTMWREGLPPDKEALLWMGGVGNFRFEKRSEYYSTQVLRVGMDLYNNKLREVCCTEKVDCIDLAVAIDLDLSVFYDCCHFNERGAQRVAEILANAPQLMRVSTLSYVAPMASQPASDRLTWNDQ